MATYLTALLLDIQIKPILIFILFRFVLGVLAAGGVNVLLATAPPDFATILTPMRSATPIVVLLLNVVFTTVLANFLLVVEFSSAHFQLFDAFFHFLAINNQGFLLFL